MLPEISKIFNFQMLGIIIELSSRVFSQGSTSTFALKGEGRSALIHDAWAKTIFGTICPYTYESLYQTRLCHNLLLYWFQIDI